MGSSNERGQQQEPQGLETEKTQEEPVIVRRVSETLGNQVGEDGRVVGKTYEAYYVGRRGGEFVRISGDEAPSDVREDAMKRKQYDRQSSWVNSPGTKPEDVAKVYEKFGVSSPEELLRLAQMKKEAEQEG